MKFRKDREEEQVNSPKNNVTSEDHQGGPVQSGAAGSPTVEPTESGSYVRELDYESIPEPGRSAYFKTTEESGRAAAWTDVEAEQAETLAEDYRLATESSDGEAKSEDERTDDDSDSGTERVDEEASSEGSTTDGKPKKGPLDDLPAASEERIVFDAWDNKQIRSVNKKAKETIEKAVLELGDHTVDSVFKGSYMAVLNPRSKEFKRFRKLGKHPELMIDPRKVDRNLQGSGR